MGLEVFKAMMAAQLQGRDYTEQRRAARELLGEEFAALEAAFLEQTAQAAPSQAASSQAAPAQPPFEAQRVVSWQGTSLWSSPPYTAAQDETMGPSITTLLRVEDYQRGATWRTLRVKGSNEAAVRSIVGKLNCLHATGCDEIYVYSLYRPATRHNRQQQLPEGAENLGWACEQSVYRNVLEAFRAIRRLRHFHANLELREKEGQGLLTFSQLLDTLDEQGIDTVAKLREARADARLAKASKCATPLQEALLVVSAEVDSYMQAKEHARGLCKHFSTCMKYPQDFGPNVKNIRTWHWENDELRDLTLEEWRATPLAYRKMAFFVGENGAGKTTLACALGRSFCIRRALEHFVVTKTLDPIGVLTRTGQNRTAACFIFDDFSLRLHTGALMNTQQMKALTDARGPCGYDARYHDAIIPEGVARFATVNLGLRNGVPDMGHWFETNGHEVLACLARRDVEGIRSRSDDERALARRVVIVAPTREDIGAPVQQLHDDLQERVAAELAREQAFEAQFAA